MKLFVVGEESPNPDDWDDDYCIVLAETIEDAIKLGDGHVSLPQWAAEVPTDRAGVLVRIPTHEYNS